MANLNWVRLDAQWPQNHKFLQLIEDKKWRAVTVYMGGLAWSGGQGQAGFVPYFALPMIHGSRKEAQELSEVGLWHEENGGYRINDWAEYQPSNEEAERRSERARTAAQKRWANR